MEDVTVSFRCRMSELDGVTFIVQEDRVLLEAIESHTGYGIDEYAVVVLSGKDAVELGNFLVEHGQKLMEDE